MADDTSLMDWTPTRLPEPFDPYPEQYIPGGWPSSPPPPTVQAFARPPPTGFFLPAAKRVCVGIGALGGFTLTCLTQVATHSSRALVSAGGFVRQNIAPRPAFIIVRAFRRQRRLPAGAHRRDRQLLPGSPFQRAAAAHDLLAQERNQILQTQFPFNRQATQLRHQPPLNIPHPSIETDLPNGLFTSQGKNRNNKRRGEPMFRPKRRVRFPTPEFESTQEIQPQITGPFSNMPSFVPPREKSPQLVNTPVHNGRHTPPACDRLTSPYPDLQPCSAQKAQNPTPPQSPSTQLLGELEIAAGDESDSDVSSTVSASWRPINQPNFPRRIQTPRLARRSRPSPNVLARTPDVSNPEISTLTPIPVVVVDAEEVTEERPSDRGTAQPLLLTPPPIRNRPHLNNSPESDISSTFDFPVIPTPELYARNLVQVDSPAIPVDLADSSKPEDANQHPSSIEDSEPRVEEEAYSHTPEQKLQKLTQELTIQDPHTPEGPTPKADRHSSEKKTRLTRAQQKKLEAEKELLKYEIVPLSAEWENKVCEATRRGHGKLNASDFARVVPHTQGRMTDNWLNDEVINEYLSLIVQHGKQNDRKDQVPTNHAFTSFFYTNLEKKGPESVKRWATRAKIGGKDLLRTEHVFIPINSGMHWTLCVVSGTKKKITHYNSMGGSGRRYIDIVKGWVKAELGTAFNEEEWTLEESGRSPQQQNMDDCGVFTITSARQIMLGFTPMSYKSSQIPVQRKRIVAELINGGLIKSHE